jgi:hypothetical protein
MASRHAVLIYMFPACGWDVFICRTNILQQTIATVKGRVRMIFLLLVFVINLYRQLCRVALNVFGSGAQIRSIF